VKAIITIVDFILKNVHTIGYGAIPLKLNKPLDRSLKQSLKFESRKKLGS
jgi:hypothetical protein